MRYVRFLTVLFACSFLHPLKAHNQCQKCVLFAVQDVLMYVDMKKVSFGGIGSMLGYTPEKIQKELADTLKPIKVKNFPTYTSIYPELVEAWLTGQLSNDYVYQEGVHYIKKHCSFAQRARLLQAIQTACTSKITTVFSSFSDSVALAQRCKSAGNTIGLCANWNKQLFDLLIKAHPASLGFFDTSYISGTLGKITETKEFYTDVIKAFGAENVVLVEYHPKILTAAKASGIKTIRHTSAAATERELKKMGFLP